ncbi:DUF1028 domain-containing protein [Sulfobacillus thermosulfidooxidans]|uniref:DUF1028 domain-containing protein n=1 Tax=Sulfobacillus thermosulfidooxidans TaxID=28034 RepID=UPI00042657C2|nr:DUF1028 domain-containing protein [Sulfobacillus thermosulfidooxidans]OLZ10223.1 pilus assembly protein [Sulfobacillus thermosulfidooxidans]OLZ17015.1 pilus assembly protein [Sulfobacillus thermosulfidooxidans]OLZ20111.1 pilus assembly protein [Sulfobacillus thermosulfidooxidans]
MKLNTFSITARCPETGQLGIAVSTKVPAVGMLCPFIESGVGAIATQSFVNPYLGIWGLQYMRQNHTAVETLEFLKRQDPGIEYRQLGIVDRSGISVGFSGSACDTWFGHRNGPNYVVAGNMLVSEDTILAMEESFLQTQGLSLAERLLKALMAGQQAGGDKRGKQSAALKVYGSEAYPLLDLRVDEHPEPVTELWRIYTVAQESLVPLIAMLPTHDTPAGRFDFEESRRRGLLQDGR